MRVRTAATLALFACSPFGSDTTSSSDAGASGEDAGGTSSSSSGNTSSSGGGVVLPHPAWDGGPSPLPPNTACGGRTPEPRVCHDYEADGQGPYSGEHVEKSDLVSVLVSPVAVMLGNSSKNALYTVAAPTTSYGYGFYEVATNGATTDIAWSNDIQLANVETPTELDELSLRGTNGQGCALQTHVDVAQAKISLFEFCETAGDDFTPVISLGPFTGSWVNVFVHANFATKQVTMTVTPTTGNTDSKSGAGNMPRAVLKNPLLKVGISFAPKSVNTITFASDNFAAYWR